MVSFELGDFGSVSPAAVESCDTFSALLVEITVDFLVDLSLEEIVAGVFGLLESEFAPVSAAVVSFDFKKLFSMILSRVEKS